MLNNKNETPSSVGTKCDLISDVDISIVNRGYFSNQKVAKSFVDLGIASIEKELPKDMRYADYGGGQGFLTKNVVGWLKSQGHNVDAFVIDANPKFLQIAEQEGLQTFQCNLESCDFKDVDLITMRAVNHYNSPEKQIEILKSALRSLKEKGFLISQISSGSEENCRLRSGIVNLNSLRQATEGEDYHWTSIEEYSNFLKEVGFANIEVVGYAPDCHWSPEEQWERFHEKETKEAGNDARKIEEINERKKRFLAEAYSLIKGYIDRFGKENLGIEFGNDGVANIKYQYPIIKGQKNKVAPK